MVRLFSYKFLPRSDKCECKQTCSGWIWFAKMNRTGIQVTENYFFSTCASLTANFETLRELKVYIFHRRLRYKRNTKITHQYSKIRLGSFELRIDDTTGSCCSYSTTSVLLMILRTEYCGCTDYIIKIKCFEKNPPTNVSLTFRILTWMTWKIIKLFSLKSFSSLGLVRDCGFANPQQNWFLFLFEKFAKFL